MRFTPSDPAFVQDPYPAYEELRAGQAVTVQDGRWLVPRFSDVDALLRDRRLGRSYLHVATHAEMGRPEDPPGLAPFWRVVRAGMLDVEPPDHTRLRRLVSTAFTPRRVEALRPRVDELVGVLVAELLETGSDGSPVDLKAIVAEPLPVTVIAELLGVPEADRSLLRPWSADICGMYELNPSAEAAATAVRAASEFSGYLRELAAQRRTHPGDDLLSALVEARDHDDRLTDDELVGTCVLLLNAGHEATVNTTVNGWHTLFRHPDELERLRADPALLPTALEELFRFDTPLQMFERYALADVELHGVTVRRGEEVALLFGSANRDPAAFAEPDRFDVGRADNPHITFGAGIHFCLGAPLARLELTASYGALLQRAPELALAADPRWAPGYVIRGLEELLVTVRRRPRGHRRPGDAAAAGSLWPGAAT